MSKEQIDDIEYVRKNLMKGLKTPPTKMNKEEIGRLSGQGQVIVKDGKFWGYPPSDCPDLDRAWRDNAVDAIIFITELDDVTKVYCPSDMSLEGAELRKITKTITITEDE